MSINTGYAVIATIGIPMNSFAIAMGVVKRDWWMVSGGAIILAMILAIGVRFYWPKKS